LVNELLDRVTGADIAVATVRATRATASIPFGAFAPWIRDIDFAADEVASVPNRRLGGAIT
jgi:hypothetical protein